MILRARSRAEGPERDGEIELLARTCAKPDRTGLIDEYRIYLHPVVLGTASHISPGPGRPLRLCLRFGLARM